MASSAEASMGVSDRPGRVGTALGLLITQRPHGNALLDMTPVRAPVLTGPGRKGRERRGRAAKRDALSCFLVAAVARAGLSQDLTGSAGPC